jgi:uncharacterized protein YegJ (DUF2314 family)
MAARMCALSVALAAASGCAEPAREFDGETRLLRTDAGDDAMNAAVERARATVPELVARLEHAPPGLTYLGVKVRLGGHGDVREHIWLYDVTHTVGTITGKLVNDAQMFPEFRAGDVVRVEPREISDWMTVENGRACGGFTSRIMVAEMNAEERAAYFKEMRIPRLPPGSTVCDRESAGIEN